MKFSLNRLRRSRIAHALSVTAILSLVVLLHPYCETADAAEGHAAFQTDGHHRSKPGDRQPLGTDTCPSLDHTPVLLPDVVTLTGGDTTAKIPLARMTRLDNRAAIARSKVAPRATPPPTASLPLYLRYAHLLI